MTFGSLFSGIGGMDLGLERAGMTCKWQVEIDEFARKVLAERFTEVTTFADIKAVRRGQLECVDLIAGGYPCQPFSVAGKRAGEGDPRHLWPHFRRIICDVRPRYALLENVPGHLSLGFGKVLSDLSRLGYDAEWLCLRASDFGASHLRKRVFIVAHRTLGGRRELRESSGGRGFVDRGGEELADADRGQREQRRRAMRARDGGFQDLTVAVGLWATPQAHDQRGAKTTEQIAAMREKGAGVRNLNEDAAHWQTPATDTFLSRGGDRKDEMGLGQQARTFPGLARPTPRTTDKAGASSVRITDETKRFQLREAVEMVSASSLPAPTIPDGPQSSQNAPGLRRRLNPRFVEWLMGFPIGWTEL